MRSFFSIVFILVLAACSKAPSSNAKAGPLQGLDHKAGFIDLYVDKNKNRVLAKLPKEDDDGISLRFIYSARLTAGLGSNPIGLDRGWGTGGQIFQFRRIGNKMIIEEENLQYRASPDNPLEERAVRRELCPFIRCQRRHCFIFGRLSCRFNGFFDK